MCLSASGGTPDATPEHGPKVSSYKSHVPLAFFWTVCLGLPLPPPREVKGHPIPCTKVAKKSLLQYSCAYLHAWPFASQTQTLYWLDFLASATSRGPLSANQSLSFCKEAECACRWDWFTRYLSYWPVWIGRPDPHLHDENNNVSNYLLNKLWVCPLLVIISVIMQHGNSEQINHICTGFWVHLQLIIGTLFKWAEGFPPPPFLFLTRIVQEEFCGRGVKRCWFCFPFPPPPPLIWLSQMNVYLRHCQLLKAQKRIIAQIKIAFNAARFQGTESLWR